MQMGRGGIHVKNEPGTIFPFRRLAPGAGEVPETPRPR